MTKKELKAKKKIDKHNLKPYTTYKHWGKHFITDKNGNVEKFFEDEASAKEYQGEVLLKQQEAKHPKPKPEKKTWFSNPFKKNK